MGCVNKSSKEFKALAQRHNLDENALELMVHKYWIETGNETLFPTDVYIQAQIGNTHYIEPGPNVRKLWELRYKSPMEFNSMSKLKVAKKNALRFFPEEAIVSYKNAQGNYVLSVMRPVEKDYSKDSFFKDLDNGSMKDTKVLDLGIKEGQSYGIDKVKELFNKFNTDRTTRDLANKVFSVASDLGINFTFDESLPFGTVGRYTNDNTVRYKKSFFERDTMNDKKAFILLHEVLHALSMYALSKQTANWKKPEALEQFKSEINSLYQELKDNPILKDERGISDVFEFIAELANPVFRAKIQNIDKDIEAIKKLQKKSFWQRILDAFKSLLGIHSTSTYYERSMNVLDKALNAFDLDTYMRYNGIKHTLRQGYNAKEWEFNSMSDEEVKTQVNNYLNDNVAAQYSKSLDVIDKAKETGKWTPKAITALNNLVTDIENGKILDQRFPQEASRGMYQGGRRNAEATLLLSRNESSSSKNPRSLREAQERNERERPVQERIIEAWAKAVGIWHNNLDTVKGKDFLAEGGEAKVFVNEGGTKVTKILSTSYFVTPQLALDRITLHNTLFPEAPLKVIGFGRNSKGEFQFLVEQPFIKGEPVTQEEIDKFITRMGFSKSSKDFAHTFVSDDLYIGTVA